MKNTKKNKQNSLQSTHHTYTYIRTLKHVFNMITKSDKLTQNEYNFIRSRDRMP